MISHVMTPIGAKMRGIKFLILTALLSLPFSVNAQTYLLMAEAQWCYWCEQWNEQIGAIYPKTAEGQTAPLPRYDLHHDDPNVTFDRRVHFTPTFILIQDSQERDGIEGYPGEDFFWGLSV